MTTPSPYARILRRETHSPRAGVAVTLAVLVVLVLAWIGTECVLALLNQPALLVAPSDAATAILELPSAVVPAALVTAGIVVAALGLVLILLAVLPGRRARHTSRTGRTAVVIDDAAIASALAGAVSRAANVNPDQVRATVGRRSARVLVQPTSGFFVNEDVIAEAVRTELELLELRPSVRSSVVISKEGVIRA